MNISLFKNVSEPRNPEIIGIIDYLIKIRDGEWQDIVIKCRNIQDKEERDLFKQKMPTACLSGEFTYRSNDSLVSHNGIIAMDLDGIDDVNNLHEKLQSDKYVFSVFVSVGGFGLRVLFKIDPNRHNDAFKGIRNYIFDKYKEVCDPNGGLSKPYIVSFDPDLYINENSEIFTKYVKETVVKNVPSYIHNNDDFKRVYEQIIGRNINIVESYEDWLKIGFGISEEYGESGRYYFHQLSRLSPKYKFEICEKQYTACLKHKGLGEKINIRSFYYLAKSNGINIASERTKDIVRITRNSKKAGLSKKQISDNLKEKSGIEGVDDFIDKVYDSTEKDDIFDSEDSTIETLELFISNNYNLRFNEVSGFFEDNGVQVNPTLMNSIYISAKKIIPKLDYQLMIRLLKSDFIPTFNPFFEFFGSDGIPVILPPIPDKDKQKIESPLIDKLASCIKNKDEAYTNYFLRKWLVSIVSSAHKIHSPLLFCLLGPQGTGKTEFLRRLMPKELMQYYAESKLDKEKDDELLMTENLIIMDDELGGKSKQDALKLKNITSKQWFSLRRPYGDHNEKILRLAVLCGTSNYKEVMSDPTGNRRIIPVEVEDIDKEKYNSIDKKELFLEMFKLYKSGFDWRISHDDLKLLNKDEQKYSITVKERDLIIKYFEPSDEDYLNTTEILIELEDLTRQKLNATIIGRELGNLDFKRKSIRVGPYNAKVTSKWGIKRINRVTTYTHVSPLPGYTPIAKEGF